MEDDGGKRGAAESMEGPGTLRLVARALALRCPACGKDKMFRGWFTMHNACLACGRLFNRGPGYFLGSIYFNYGITATIIVAMFFGLYFSDWLTSTQLLTLMSVFGVIFPIWFFRYARTLWVAFDERWDPWPNEEERREMARK